MSLNDIRTTILTAGDGPDSPSNPKPVDAPGDGKEDKGGDKKASAIFVEASGDKDSEEAPSQPKPVNAPGDGGGKAPGEKKAHDAGRRAFLTGAAAAPAALAGGVLSAGAAAASPVEAPSALGLRRTEHVLKYYASARF